MSKIIQWNCKSIRSKISDILFLVNSYSPSLFAISETWLPPGRPFGIPGYSCLRDDRQDGWAGSALLVKRSLVFDQLPIPHHNTDNFNAVALRTFGISFASIYIPHPNVNSLRDLRELIMALPPPVVLMGDFNAHHSSWGSHSCSPFGTLLLDLLDDVNLCIINSGAPIRRTSPAQNPSAVDLTICSPNLASLLSWDVLYSSLGSDHFPILVSVPFNSPACYHPPPLLKYNLHKANWSAFSETLDERSDTLPLVNPDNCISAYTTFVDYLKSSADSHIPLKQRSRFKKSPPWWDAECSESIRKRKLAEQQYNSAMTMDNFLNFQRVAAHTKKLLSQKKKLGWSKFCESMSPGTPPSLVWKQIKRFRSALSRPNINSNNPAAWIESFADKLAPPTVPPLDFLPINPNSTILSLHPLDNLFSFDELQVALHGLTDTSPGGDGIPYSFLVKAPDKTKDYYLKLVNHFFELGIIPESWNKQIIIPIVKPGKDSLTLIALSRYPQHYLKLWSIYSKTDWSGFSKVRIGCPSHNTVSERVLVQQITLVF